MIDICANALGKWKVSTNKWQQLTWQLTSRRWLASKVVDHVGIYRTEVVEFNVALVSVADMMATSRRERFSTWCCNLSALQRCFAWWFMVLMERSILTLIARFMGPTWGPSGADRTQVGPVLAPRTLPSGYVCSRPQIQYMFSYNALCWESDLSRAFRMKLSGDFPGLGDEAQHYFLWNSPWIDF